MFTNTLLSALNSTCRYARKHQRVTSLLTFILMCFVTLAYMSGKLAGTYYYAWLQRHDEVMTDTYVRVELDDELERTDIENYEPVQGVTTTYTSEKPGSLKWFKAMCQAHPDYMPEDVVGNKSRKTTWMTYYKELYV